MNAVSDIRQNALTAVANISIAGNTTSNIYSYTHPVTHGITDVNGLQTSSSSKQDTLITGTDITIVGNAVDSTCSDTHHLTHTIAEITNLQTSSNAKLNTLQAGANISIVGNTTNNTYLYTQPLTHTVAEVGGLQTALNHKVDDSQVLTNVQASSLFTDAAYTHPSSHSIAEASGLQTSSNNKQNNLSAGIGITISNNTISATSGSPPLILQLDGVTQSSATTLNSVLRNESLSGGVLNVSSLVYYHRIAYIYSTSSTIAEITQDSSSNLLWGTDMLATNSSLRIPLCDYTTLSFLTGPFSNYMVSNPITNLVNAKQDT